MIILYKFSVITSPVMFYTFSALSQFFFSGFNTAIYAIIPDCVEYGEWKTGYRTEGLANSAASFGYKVGNGLGSAVLGWILAIGGYMAQSATQSSSAIFSIRLVYVIVPIVIYALVLIILKFYNLDKEFDEIVSDLKSRAENK